MPLSEGATRARQARRLLQKVLDYVPEGTVIHPLVRIGRHAAAGIVEAAAEQEADLMIFGWGGKSGPNRDAHAPVISPDDRRGRPRVAVRHRGRQAARRARHPADPGPGPRRPARGARAAVRRRARPCATTRPCRVMHVVPAGVTEAVRAQAEHALAAFARQHVTARSEPILRETANVRTAILREAERADLVVMGASAPPGEPGTSLFGALPEAIAQRARAHGHRRQDPRAHRPPDVRAAGAAGRDASRPPTAPPRSRAPSRPGSTAGSPRPTSTTPSSPTSPA